MVGGMTDLTERKNLEAQLLHSKNGSHWSAGWGASAISTLC